MRTDLKIVLLLWLCTGVILGCGDEKMAPTLPGAHGNSWMDTDSPDFHGTVALASGTVGCATCHGADWKGGKVGVSCIDCHLTRAIACISCHGGQDNTTGAPPIGLAGETADTTIAVGAHTTHLADGQLSTGFECTVCHQVPSFVLDPGHLDDHDGIAEISWGGTAVATGIVWNRTSRTCSATYCHGNFTGGAAANSPVWTGENQAECGSCHDVGSDPASLEWKHAFHVTTAGLACADCHAGVVDLSLAITNRGLHVNGVADTLTRDESLCLTCHGPGGLSCTACHGGVDNETGAPPVGLAGETSTADLAVGAHTLHLAGGAQADGFPCTECHLTPVTVADAGHLDADSIAEMTFGVLAGSGSSWNRSTASCGLTYCHGNFTGGVAANSPVWTGENQAECGSCHDVGSNPERLSGMHKKHVVDESLSCRTCHVTTVDAAQNIIGTQVHVDGEKTVSFLGSGFFSNGSCSGLGAGCHGNENWYDN